MNLRIGFFILLLMVGAANASILQVSSGVSRNPGDGTVFDMDSGTVDIIVLITGGTGNGLFIPLLIWQGTTNESNGVWDLLGAEATVESPFYVSAGDAFSSAGASGPPIGNCPYANGCLIPFTFGVPQQLHIEASTHAAIELNPSLTGTIYDMPMSVHSSVELDGAAVYSRDDRGSLQSAVVSVTVAPEPGSLITVLLALVLIVLGRYAPGYRERAT